MPREQQVAIGPAECGLLIRKEFERRLGVQPGIVSLSPNQPSVLVVLDEVVVGIGRKRQGTESQRVEHRQPQECELRSYRREVGDVEVEDVVPDQAIRVPREAVEFGKAVRKLARPYPAPGEGVATFVHRGERMDAVAAPGDLEVKGEEPHPSAGFHQMSRDRDAGRHAPLSPRVSRPPASPAGYGSARESPALPRGPRSRTLPEA